MTVNKITKAPTQKEVIDKINEVIDEIGGSGGTVTSVNGQTGDVSLDADDVGALPDSTSIPTKISDLTDDTSTYPIDKADYATSAGTLGSSDVGSATQPIYLDDGAPTTCTYSLNKTVPADAVFTDTTYSAFTGADGSSAGTSGLVPAPSATDNNKFLKGDGTWGSAGSSLPSQTGQSGKFLTTDGTDASWANVSSQLSDLTDVTITSATNGQSLVYNNTSGKWVNQTKYAMVITDYTT